jgi:hypothetical protein
MQFFSNKGLWHRLYMWRWSFSGVRKLHDNLKPRFAFQQWNRCQSWEKKLKKHLSEWAWCQKAIGGFYFTKKWRAETLQPGLEFDNFKPRLKSGIFKCISWLQGSIFGRDDRCFLKGRVRTYLMAPTLPLNSPSKFSVFTSIFYGHWWHSRPSKVLWLHYTSGTLEK